MGDISFTAKKAVQVNSKDVSWISRLSDLFFRASKGKTQQQADNGVDLLIGQVPEHKATVAEAEVLDVYFAKEKKTRHRKRLPTPAWATMYY